LRLTLNPAFWSDYVFDKSYELRSIEEMEKFIEQNHHLPDVPSAKELGEKGVDMVSMDATLLKKIEELSLYVIQLNEELKVVKKENAAIIKKLDQ